MNQSVLLWKFLWLKCLSKQVRHRLHVHYSRRGIDIVLIIYADILVYTEKVSGRITRSLLPIVTFEGGTEKKIRLVLHLICLHFFKMFILPTDLY